MGVVEAVHPSDGASGVPTNSNVWLVLDTGDFFDEVPLSGITVLVDGTARSGSITTVGRLKPERLSKILVSTTTAAGTGDSLPSRSTSQETEARSRKRPLRFHLFHAEAVSAISEQRPVRKSARRSRFSWSLR